MIIRSEGKQGEEVQRQTKLRLGMITKIDGKKNLETMIKMMIRIMIENNDKK